MVPLTKRQSEVLSIIVKMTNKRGHPPTWAELSKELGITTTAVNDILVALQRKQRVDWEPRLARTLRVL